MSMLRMLFGLIALLGLWIGSTAGQRKQQDPKCLLPMEPGPCRMSLDRFYYNSKTNTCDQFKFGGCRGNDNKFGFRKSCEDACVQPASTSPKPIK